MDNAIADTAPANTAMPTALSCSFFPIVPSMIAKPPTTTPNAASGATAVVPNSASGFTASAKPAKALTIKAIPALF